MELVRTLGYSLQFRDETKKIPNTMIETYKSVVDDCYVVEFWDVTKSYFSLKSLERDLDEEKNKLKELEKTVGKKHDDYLELKTSISSQDKFQNKRKLIPIKDFDKMFKITQVTKEVKWTNIDDFIKYNNKNKLNHPTKSPNEVFNLFYLNRTGLVITNN